MGFYYSLQIRKKKLWNPLLKVIPSRRCRRVFDINRITLYRWSLLKKETNDLKPKINHNIKKKQIDIIKKLKESI
jgi:hypothetical protein